MKNYDIVILGAGPAGLTAGIYAARYKLSCLIIGKMPGGLTSEAVEIHNFPTYEKISGIEFVKKLMSQVKNLGVEIKTEEVFKLSKVKNQFNIKTNKSEYQAKKLILASGTERRKLGIPGEKEFLGKGVAYCATCDAPLYKEKTTAVVGGGNSALTAANLLAKYSKKVYLIYRGDKYRADPAYIEQIEKNKKIEKIFNENVIKILGKQNVEKIELSSRKNINIDGLFIEAGTIPNEELASQLELKRETGYTLVNKHQETSVKGVFAAGDITNNPLKQVLTACAEGAIAAYSAYKELGKEKS